MGKKKEKSVGGGNRRRQILQLETEAQKTLGNPLGGYLSHYMDSEEEDDLDERATPEKETKANNSLTNQVEDFLKEIDAISSVAAVTELDVAKTSTSESAKVEVIATESKTSVTGDVPQCDWQECHDEGSGYTYYWNLRSNEVTWECPDEYRQYVERLVALKQSVPPSTNLAIPSSSSLKSSERGDSDTITSSTSTNVNAEIAKVTTLETAKQNRKSSIEEGKVVLITSYGWSSSNEENSSDDENEVVSAPIRNVVLLDENVSTSRSPIIIKDEQSSVYYGPIEAPEPTSDGVLLYGPSLPPELSNAADSNDNEVLPKTRVVSSSNSLSDDSVSSVKSESNPSSPNSWVLTGQAVVSQSTYDSEVEEIQEEPDSTTLKHKLQPSPPRIECSLAKFDGNTDKSSLCTSSISTGATSKSTANDVDRLKWEDNHQDYLQYNPDNTGNGRPCRPGFGFEKREESSDNNTIKRKNFRKRAAAVSFVKSETLDLNEVNLQNALEYEARSVDSQASDNVGDSFDDIDIIERELDIALERKRTKGKDGEHQEKSSKSEVSDEDSTDRITSIKHPDSSVSLVVKSDPIKETEDDIGQDSVGDVSSVILEKLGHFGATTSDLTDLQILVIELKTRLKDWIEGALNTGYFVNELKVYKERIRRLESASVPEGWTCEWDRLSKCYNYINVTTGQTRRKHPKNGDETTRKLVKREETFDTVTERLLDIPAFANYSATSSSDLLPTVDGSEVPYSYSTTFLHQDSCLPPLPIVLPETVPLPSPPLPPPDSPPLPPPPPDSTESFESTTETAAPIPTPPEDEVPNTSSSVSAFPVYETVSAPDIYPTSSALESELDSFYSNIAAEEANVASWSAPSVPIVTPLVEVLVPTVVDSRESDPPVEIVPTVQRPSTSTVTTKKKMKKTKIASGLIMKKKNIPSLVEKWKRIKQEQLEENEMSPTSSRTGGSS